MKYVIFGLIALLVIATGFAMGVKSGMSINNRTVTTQMNMNATNRTMHGTMEVNGTKHSANVTVNLTENGTNIIVTKTVSTKQGNITMERIINIIKNKENRNYVFRLLNNNSVSKETKTTIKRTIMQMIRNDSELRREIAMNKTLLIQFVPKYKYVIEKGTIENVTVEKYGNNTVMEVKVIEHKKLFGLIPVNVPEEIQTNETTAELKRPWWAIFAI